MQDLDNKDSNDNAKEVDMTQTFNDNTIKKRKFDVKKDTNKMTFEKLEEMLKFHEDQESKNNNALEFACE